MGAVERERWGLLPTVPTGVAFPPRRGTGGDAYAHLGWRGSSWLQNRAADRGLPALGGRLLVRDPGDFSLPGRYPVCPGCGLPVPCRFASRRGGYCPTCGLHLAAPSRRGKVFILLGACAAFGLSWALRLRAADLALAAVAFTVPLAYVLGFAVGGPLSLLWPPRLIPYDDLPRHDGPVKTSVLAGPPILTLGPSQPPGGPTSRDDAGGQRSPARPPGAPAQPRGH